jgi:hypothetical protein
MLRRRTARRHGQRGTTPSAWTVRAEQIKRLMALDFGYTKRAL